MVYRKDWVQPAAGEQGFARTMKAYGRKINLSTADLGTTGNVIGLFVVPANFCVINWVGPAIPAFGTALAVSIGTPASPALFLSASSALAAGGAFSGLTMATTGPFTRTTSQTEVQMLITTQSSAPVAGIFELYIYGFIL